MIHPCGIALPPPGRHSRESGNPHPAIRHRRPLPVITAAPHRHSRESGNPHPIIRHRRPLPYIPTARKSPPFAKGGLGGLPRRRHSTNPRIVRPSRRSLSVIPAKAGIHTPPSDNATSYPPFPPPYPSFPRKRESTPHPIDMPEPTGVLDSGLRRNDGGRRAALSDYGVWIPAFAGMTDGGECERGAFYCVAAQSQFLIPNS